MTAEGCLRNIGRIALECDLSRRASFTMRFEANVESYGLPGRHNERKSNSAHGISVACPIGRCHPDT